MKFLKKKVNMFGKAIPVFAIAILGMAIITAALVPYLSNAVIGHVTVDYAAEVSLAKIDALDATSYTTLPVILTTEGWITDLKLDDTHQLSTSEVGIKIVNNADVPIEGKFLKLTVSNTEQNVVCEELASLKFLDTATQTQLNKGYQELESLCVLGTVAGTVVYNIPIQSLASGQTYEYPVKITFGVVNPTTYTLTAQMTTA